MSVADCQSALESELVSSGYTVDETGGVGTDVCFTIASKSGTSYNIDLFEAGDVFRYRIDLVGAVGEPVSGFASTAAGVVSALGAL